jgi:hypothetical protein
MNTSFQYKGHRVEITGDRSALTITVDGKDYTPFYKGSDLSPEMWIIGHIDAQAHFNDSEFKLRDLKIREEERAKRPRTALSASWWLSRYAAEKVASS